MMDTSEVTEIMEKVEIAQKFIMDIANYFDRNIYELVKGFRSTDPKGVLTIYSGASIKKEQDLPKLLTDYFNDVCDFNVKLGFIVEKGTTYYFCLGADPYLHICVKADEKNCERKDKKYINDGSTMIETQEQIEENGINFKLFGEENDFITEYYNEYDNLKPIEEQDDFEIEECDDIDVMQFVASLLLQWVNKWIIANLK